MLFNVVVLVSAVVVLIRHERSKAAMKNIMVDKKSIVRLTVSVGGITSIFGLTWLFAILSVGSTQELRETFQILFTVSNAFQGFFIFFFICIISSDSRDEWKRFANTKIKSWISRRHSSTKSATVTMLKTNMYTNVHVKSM